MSFACTGVTNNYSGAEIQGVVNSALSLGLKRLADSKNDGVSFDSKKLKVSFQCCFTFQ